MRFTDGGLQVDQHVRQHQEACHRVRGLQWFGPVLLALFSLHAPAFGTGIAPVVQWTDGYLDAAFFTGRRDFDFQQTEPEKLGRVTVIGRRVIGSDLQLGLASRPPLEGGRRSGGSDGGGGGGAIHRT